MTSRIAPTMPRLDSDWRTSRHDNNGWPKFLQSVTLDGIRGWTGQTIEFRFPIVAIAGENGAGKSTILKTAASAYLVGPQGEQAGAHSYSPDDFFPNTPWETVSGVTLSYSVREGVHTREGTLRKLTVRWRGMPERQQRPVYFLDISRTQPIDTLIGYGRLARVAIAGESAPVPLTDESMHKLSRVLSRSYELGEMSSDSTGKQVGVLTSGGRQYSNFHQGAGEDATMDLVALLQRIPRQSLVLIDEIESSLHPRAQRRLMTELVDIARTARLQFILTTHSPYVLDQLPPEARIYITNDRNGVKDVVYGITAEYAIGRMDDEQHPELDVYCEDAEAAYLVDALIRSVQPQSLGRVNIVFVGPASTVRTMGELASRQDKLPRPSIGVLDADQADSVGCVRLPGSTAPEKEVFTGLGDADLDTLAERLGVRSGDLKDVVADAMRDDEFHTWSSRIAEGISPGLRKSRVWENAVDVWVRQVLPAEQREEFVNATLAQLPAPAAAPAPTSSSQPELDIDGTAPSPSGA